jgi:hypothetical protein
VNADAVKAAAEALRFRGHACPYHRDGPHLTPFGGCDSCRAVVDDARAAVGAAEPIIRAAIAAEIRAQAAAAGGADSDVAYGLAYAARIAEGTP